MVKPISKATIAGYLIRMFRLSTFLRRAYSIAVKTEFGHVDSNVVLEIGKYFMKARSLGAHMIRLGSANDGGYVVFQDFDLSDVCLSFGIGDNNSFDFDLSSMVEIVKMYDHTVDSPPLKFENGDFYRIGISHVAQPGFITVHRILEETPPEKEVVLKIDIEGLEPQALSSAAHLLSLHPVRAATGRDANCILIACQFHSDCMPIAF